MEDWKPTGAWALAFRRASACCLKVNERVSGIALGMDVWSTTDSSYRGRGFAGFASPATVLLIRVCGQGFILVLVNRLRIRDRDETERELHRLTHYHVAQQLSRRAFRLAQRLS